MEDRSVSAQLARCAHAPFYARPWRGEIAAAAHLHRDERSEERDRIPMLAPFTLPVHTCEGRKHRYSVQVLIKQTDRQTNRQTNRQTGQVP